MRRIFILALSGFLLLFPLVSLAAVFQDGQNSFELEAPLLDDLYVTGERVDIGETVRDDVFAAGERVEITGEMGADVYAAGGTVRVSGKVADDLHAAGRDVEIRSTVTGDIFAAGQNVTIGPEASAGQDLYAAGEQVVIAGQVGGTVRAAGEVTVAATARIAGDLKVYGSEAPIIEEGATIGGEVTVEMAPERPDSGKKLVLLAWVRSVVALFILSWLMVYGARGFTRRVLGVVGEQSGKSILTGAVWLLLFIPASILLLVSLIGIPIAVGVLLLTTLTCLAATGIAAAGLGRWILGKVSRDSGADLTWVHALVGAVVYKGVQFLPVVGWLATFVLVLFFFGATLLTLFKLLRNYDKPSTTSPSPTSP